MIRISGYLKQGFFLVWLFFALTNYVVAAGTAEKEVKKAYENWCSAIATAKGKAENVVKFYAPNAILLPTLSPKVIRNIPQGGMNQYFELLTSYPSIKCTTNKLLTNVYGDVAINTGLYTFSYLDKQDNVVKAIPARFTFVYQKIDDNWLIINHNSSVLPEDISI
jgi:hypothetical protein